MIPFVAVKVTLTLELSISFIFRPEILEAFASFTSREKPGDEIVGGAWSLETS